MPDLLSTPHCPSQDRARQGAASSPLWELLDPQSVRNPTICRELRKLMEQSGDFPLLHHDPIWLGADADQPTEHSPLGANALYISRRNDVLIGYAPFTCGSRALRFAIGELILYRRRLRSFTLVRDIIVAGGSETRLALTRALLDTLGQRLHPDEGLFLEGVPTDSVLFQIASAPAPNRRLLTVRLSDIFEHQFARLPATFRDYEAQLGYVSRKSFANRTRNSWSMCRASFAPDVLRQWTAWRNSFRMRSKSRARPTSGGCSGLA